MDKVRVCIVGMGIGRANGRAFMKNSRSEIVALCDVLEDRMQDFAKEIPNEVKFYTDYKTMCKDPDIDAVFVGTPNQLHVPVALEVLRNDKHVMVTKPLASSLAQAAEVVEVAEKSGLVNMMSLGMRFSNQVQYLGKLRQQGYFGDLYYARAQAIRRSRIPDWSLGFVREGGGAFRDMGVHVLDAVWWLLGMPKPISVTGVAGAMFGPRGKGYWDFRQPDESYWRVRATGISGSPTSPTGASSRPTTMAEALSALRTASACRSRAFGPAISSSTARRRSTCWAPTPAPACGR